MSMINDGECRACGCMDYAIWQTASARNLSRDEYFTYLDRVYAEKTGYTNRIKAIIKTKGL